MCIGGSVSLFKTGLLAADVQIVVARLPRPNVAQPVDLPDGSVVADALRRLGTPPDAVIVLRKGTPIPLDAPLASGDELKVISVFSGG